MQPFITPKKWIYFKMVGLIPLRPPYPDIKEWWIALLYMQNTQRVVAHLFQFSKIMALLQRLWYNNFHLRMNVSNLRRQTFWKINYHYNKTDTWIHMIRKIEEYWKLRSINLVFPQIIYAAHTMSIDFSILKVSKIWTHK